MRKPPNPLMILALAGIADVIPGFAAEMTSFEVGAHAPSLIARTHKKKFAPKEDWKTRKKRLKAEAKAKRNAQ